MASRKMVSSSSQSSKHREITDIDKNDLIDDLIYSLTNTSLQNGHQDEYETLVAELDVSKISTDALFKDQEPKRIGCYSTAYNFVTMKRRFYPNKFAVKCLRSKFLEPPLDLFRGYTDDIDWGVLDHSLNSFLEWISKNAESICSENVASIENINADFICMRGVLSSIMDIPYLTPEGRSNWKIAAVKVGKSIYFSLGTAERSSVANSNKLCYSGFKFEQLMAYCPFKVGSNNLHYGIIKDFCCVFKKKINNHSILYAAKIDCIEEDSLESPLEDMKFLELQSMKIPDFTHNAFRDKMSLRARYLFYKAILTDIVGVYLGLRENSNQVYKILRKMTIDELMVFTNTWSPNQVMNCLENFLQLAKKHITEEKVCYLMCFPDKRRPKISFLRTSYPVTLVLPNWYIDEETID